MKLNDLNSPTSQQTLRDIAQYGLSEALRGSGKALRFLTTNDERYIIICSRQEYYRCKYEMFVDILDEIPVTTRVEKAVRRVVTALQREIDPVGKKAIMEWLRANCDIVDRADSMGLDMTLDMLNKRLVTQSRRMERLEAEITSRLVSIERRLKDFEGEMSIVRLYVDELE